MLGKVFMLVEKGLWEKRSIKKIMIKEIWLEYVKISCFFSIDFLIFVDVIDLIFFIL